MFLLNQALTCCMLVHAWFLEIFGSYVVRVCCMCVCLLLEVLIISDVIQTVWLVKQVLWLLLAFNCFIWYLLLIKWMGVAILTQLVVNACQRKLRWHSTSYRKIAFSFTVIISVESNSLLLLKIFTTKPLGSIKPF